MDAICTYLVPQYYEREMLGMCSLRLGSFYWPCIHAQGALLISKFWRNLYSAYLATAHWRTLTFANRTYIPEVLDHLRKVSIPISLITLPWLLCLFVGHLKPKVCAKPFTHVAHNIPNQASMRVLDCFFHEGPTIMFSFALAILRLNEHNIVGQQYGDVVVEQVKAWLQENSESIFHVRFNLPQAALTIVLTACLHGIWPSANEKDKQYAEHAQIQVTPSWIVAALTCACAMQSDNATGRHQQTQTVWTTWNENTMYSITTTPLH